MKYAFAVVNKSGMVREFKNVFVLEFEGGYVGEMLATAQRTARSMGGKLVSSSNGCKVEAGDHIVKRLAAELFGATVNDVTDKTAELTTDCPRNLRTGESCNCPDCN